MLFNSIEFAIFLPHVFFIYWFVVNRNLRLQHLCIVANPKTVWVKLKSYFIYNEKIVHRTPLGMYYYPNQKTHLNNSGMDRVKPMNDFWIVHSIKMQTT